MRWDIAIARAIKGRAGQSATPGGYLSATVACTAPLTLSVYDGEIFATGDALKLTQTAAACAWQAGDKAAVLLNAGGMLVIDKEVRA